MERRLEVIETGGHGEVNFIVPDNNCNNNNMTFTHLVWSLDCKHQFLLSIIVFPVTMIDHSMQFNVEVDMTDNFLLKVIHVDVTLGYWLSRMLNDNNNEYFMKTVIMQCLKLETGKYAVFCR